MFTRLIKPVLALILIAGLCLAYGFFIEPKLLKVRQFSISPSNYAGETLRIALFSDIHVGDHHVSAARVEKIVKSVNELRPDVILIPGDFINGHERREDHNSSFNADVERGLSALKDLTASMGVFASIGNHDVWYDADFVEDKLKAGGINVLRNQAVTLAGGICIVGLADHDTQTEDPAAFNQCKTDAYPIALMHSPDSFPLLSSDTVLAVAGHTHGGQINIPLIGRRVTATSAGRQYAYGLVDVDGVPAFVTAGIGTSILPARFRSPPEIVLIELTPH